MIHHASRALFVGVVGSPASTLPPSLLTGTRDEDRHTAFDQGHLTHDATRGHLHYREQSELRCLAAGTPRFNDPELAHHAREHGVADAWLLAYRQHGARCPTLASGRFAVLVIDVSRPAVFIATDRFGTWPVCYAIRNGGLHFSDRADTVPLADKPLSPQAIFDYLYFHVIPSPATIFEGVVRMPAAHVLEWTPQTHALRPWWTPRFDDDQHPDLEQSKQRFMQLVEEAVRDETDNGNAGKVGAFLSGGTDSSTVSGMLCKVTGQPAQAYSIGFDAQGYDEMEYARIAARRFGVDHRAYYVTPDDLFDGIPTVAVHYDQPFGNSSAVPAWICASRARADGIDKLLAGDGGDELFGGNKRYAKQRVFGWYECVPSPLRRFALQPVLGLPGMNKVPLVKKAVSYVEQARVPLPDRMQMYNMLERLGPAMLFTPEFLARVDRGAPLALQRETWQAAETGALINRMLAWDWKYTLADNDLPKVIGTTTLAGVDVGFPFLSDELLAFSLGLPPEWKLKGLTLRWFFKEALRGFLPDEIITKKKHGFGLPFGVWACQHAALKTLARDTLGSLGTRGIVRPEFIHALLDTHLPAHPGYYGEMVWILMMLELWLQHHAPDETLHPA